MAPDILTTPGHSTGRVGHACRPLFRLRRALPVKWLTTPSSKKSCSSADTTGGIWAIPGFGMARLLAGHAPRPRIIPRPLPVQCSSPIQMAGLMCMADSMDVFTKTPCGNGPAPTGINCLSRWSRTLALQRRLGSTVSPVKWCYLVVLFGGLAAINPVNTWTYDGTSWTLQFPRTQPPWVYAGSAAFDPNLKAVVLFGGGSGGIDQNTTWEWIQNPTWEGTGFSWKQVVTTKSPPAREGAGMAYDPTLGHVIIFGGQNSEVPLGDTWELVP